MADLRSGNIRLECHRDFGGVGHDLVYSENEPAGFTGNARQAGRTIACRPAGQDELVRLDEQEPEAIERHRNAEVHLAAE